MVGINLPFMGRKALSKLSPHSIKALNDAGWHQFAKFPSRGILWGWACLDFIFHKNKAESEILSVDNKDIFRFSWF